MKPIEWDDAHRVVALRRTYEMAGAEASAGNVDHAHALAGLPWSATATEGIWRTRLVCVGLDAARIDREVALVHALATATPETRAMIAAAREAHERTVRKLASGRHTSETVWLVKYPDGSQSHWPTRDDAMQEAKPNRWRKRARVARVTRIRRVR